VLIDTHNAPTSTYGAAKILQNMVEQGIDQMWLLTWETPATDTMSS
jgi:hypothetical protein